jgi:hypothetical protein
MAAFFDEHVKKRIVLSEKRVDPAEIEEHLEIEEIRFRKIVNHTDEVSLNEMGSSLDQQFVITGKGLDHIFPVREEEVFEDK